MIQLSSVLWGMVAFFAVVGYQRGWTKEIIAMTGIILALFTIEQLRAGLLRPFTSGAGANEQFILYSGLLLIITVFAYQTPQRFEKRKSRRRKGNRDALQESLLGALIGGFNAYLVFGTLWFYMVQLNYPLSPFVVQPGAGSPSAVMESQLPLTWLLEGNLLTIILIGLFLFVIVALV